ncbi:MAG: pseudouridine-5'-phosphate glycosidase [Bacilli bacterium]
MTIEEIMKNIPDLSSRPAVALETTVLTHGMPFPQNVECALACEEKIRQAGAEPYTIGIIDGNIKIGLTRDEIEALGQNHSAIKVSRKDIPYCLANNLTGSTTVAATMFLASLAGIKVFGTGGIGGVHRGFNETMDVSADLNEFARTPVTVVCAGPKAILDIPRTLEYLETQGVAVIGYQTEYMPLFYTRTSSYKLDISAKNAKEIAEMIHISDTIGLHQGNLIVNPIPEDYSIPYEWMDEKIQEALTMMENDHITGKRVTPYLLDKLVGLTDGKSLESNMALIINNAYVAGLIAKELHDLKK